MQVCAERDARAEACPVGDEIDGPVGGLQQVPGEVDAPEDEPLAGTHADLGAEPPGEGAHADVGVGGHGGESEGFGRRSMAHAWVGAVPAAVGSGTGPDHTGLREITSLVEDGRLRVIVDQVFPLDEAARAHASGETGRTTGKIVLAVIP